MRRLLFILLLVPISLFSQVTSLDDLDRMQKLQYVTIHFSRVGAAFQHQWRATFTYWSDKPLEVRDKEGNLKKYRSKAHLLNEMYDRGWEYVETEYVSDKTLESTDTELQNILFRKRRT